MEQRAAAHNRCNRQINTKGVTLACITFFQFSSSYSFSPLLAERRGEAIDQHDATRNKTKPVTYTTYFLTDLRRKRFARIVRQLRCKLNFNFPREEEEEEFEREYSSYTRQTKYLSFHSTFPRETEHRIDPKKHPLTDTR